MAAVALPRFDLRDPSLIKKFTAQATATRYGLPIDVEGYRRLVLYYRGGSPPDSLIPPFCYRPLAPFIASSIPAPPLTAINILNLISLFLTLLVMDAVLLQLGASCRARNIASLLFIVSFPTFYYGTIGFVDPPAILLVSLLALLTLRGWLWAAVPCSALACLTKETNLAFTTLPILWILLAHKRGAPVWVPALLAPALGFALIVSLRAFTLFPEPAWFLRPNLQSLTDNLTRARTYMSLLLTLGIPGALATIALYRGTPTEKYGVANAGLLLCGCAIAFGLYLYSVVGAYTDGRIIWIIYPFAIPLGVSLIGGRSSRRSAQLAGLSDVENGAENRRTVTIE